MTLNTSNVLIAIATYNERENIPDLLRAIRLLLPQVDILVIDDNSPDGTGQWLDQQAASDPLLHVRHRPGKLGLGTATIDALTYATAHDYGVVVTLDADGSHNPKHIPEMLQRLRAVDGVPVDVVIGSRYAAGGGIQGWPWYRLLMSRAVNAAARWLLGLTVRDCSGAFRAVRVDLIRRVDLGAVRSRGYSFFEEILWHFKRAGAHFAEVPIVFVNRVKGESKINAGEAVRSLAVLVRLGVRNWLGI